MKNKLASILMVVTLTLSMLMTAMPIMPTNASPSPTLNYETAIVKASDRLVALQADITEDNAGNGAPDDDPDDGGWNWLIDETATGYVGTGPSSENLYGITALGILKTYKINPKETYMTAMEDAYTGANNRPEVDSAPDFIFLVKLSQLTGNPVYAELARERYQTKISSVGDYNGDGEVNATDIAEYIRDVRHSQGYDGMIPWDINFYVQAALALNSYYPGEGYDKDAIAMAEVIYQDMIGNPGYFIHPVNQWFYYYVLGLSGALQAFTSTGTHLTGNFSAEEIKNFLIENQSNDGSWNSTSYWDGTNWYWAYPDVQSTAYAIMALISYGDSASISAATKAADWLISKQNPNGGWTVSSECPEVDSEAAQAIFDVIQAVGTVDVDHGSDGTIDLKTITIQQAINAAYPNDTIIVHEGIYNEGLTVDKEGLTILGLCDVILDGTGIDVDYGIHITADNVVIKNFHIANFTYGWGWGVQLTGADHCLLENLLVEKCNSGINLYRGSDHNIIQNCEINGIGGHGISIYGSDVGCTHNIIRNNKMIGCAWYMPYGKYHLAVMPIFSNASYNVIEGNILTGTGVGYGICLWGYTYGRADMPETENLIRANNISNFDTAIYIRGRNPETSTLNLVSETCIIENNLTNNRVGVYVEGFDGNVIGLLHHNNIEGNTEYGALFNVTYGTAVLDARFNWWGNASGPGGMGPGAGDAISENVTYSPWLGYPYGTVPMTYYVDPAGKIQDAINDASAGDTIIVHDGTYSEALYINKSLIIKAASKPVIRGCQSMLTNYGPRDAVIFVENAVNVVIEGFEIEGEGLGTINQKSYAVIFENASGTIKDCIISPNTIGDMYGTAVGAWDGSDLAIIFCTIKNFGRVGVFYFDGCSGGVYNTMIEGQVYSDESYVNYGIEVESWNNPCNIEIIKSEIYNCDNTHPSPLWSSAGIVIDGWRLYYDLPMSTVRIMENSIHDNYYGIEVVANSLSYAHYNNFQNNREYGVIQDPDYAGNNATFDATFNWWGDETGPYHNTTWTYKGEPYGPHYGLGDCVSDYVLYDPWLEYSWPAPPPTMKVEPSVYTAKFINETFSINITINNLSIGWKAVTLQFGVTYNSTMLEVVSVTEGSFLQQFGDTSFVYAVDYHHLYGDYVFVEFKILPNATGQWNVFANGSGVLATITFKVIHQVRGYDRRLGYVVPIPGCNFTLVETKIISADNYEVGHYTEDGYCEVLPTNIADINYDGMVDLVDFYAIASSFGETPDRPGWNPNLDINKDGVIDLADVYIAALNFGWEQHC